MSYFYYVIGQKENAGEINTPVKISESNNLYSVFSGLKKYNLYTSMQNAKRRGGAC